MESLEARVIGMEAKMDCMIAMMKQVIESENSKVMNIKQVAEYLGVSQGSMYHKRYLLPNFGENVTGGVKAEWSKKEIDDWIMAKPVEERKKEYYNRAVKTTARALGK